MILLSKIQRKRLITAINATPNNSNLLTIKHLYFNIIIYLDL